MTTGIESAPEAVHDGQLEPEVEPCMQLRHPNVCLYPSSVYFIFVDLPCFSHGTGYGQTITAPFFGTTVTT
jgi:hypothetical protein